MAKPTSDGWVSVVEAAERLGVARETVYQAIEQGRLKARLKTITRKVLRIDPKSLAGFEVSESHQKRGKRAARNRRARNE